MGAIRDMTASFHIPFIIAGISFLVSALMHFYVMWIIRREATLVDQSGEGKGTPARVNV